jgi:hypothetical protein
MVSPFTTCYLRHSVIPSKIVSVLPLGAGKLLYVFCILMLSLVRAVSDSEATGHSHSSHTFYMSWVAVERGHKM